MFTKHSEIATDETHHRHHDVFVFGLSKRERTLLTIDNPGDALVLRQNGQLQHSALAEVGAVFGGLAAVLLKADIRRQCEDARIWEENWTRVEEVDNLLDVLLDFRPLKPFQLAILAFDPRDVGDPSDVRSSEEERMRPLRRQLGSRELPEPVDFRTHAACSRS